MKEIHRDIYRCFYSHIALYDTEDVNSYPIFEVDEKQDVIFRSKGVAVTTNNDEDIEVIVYRSNKKPKESYYLFGEIEVGNKGLTIGNEAINDKHSQVICGLGTKTIYVATNISTEEILIITFIIIKRIT